MKARPNLALPGFLVKRTEGNRAEKETNQRDQAALAAAEQGDASQQKSVFLFQ